MPRNVILFDLDGTLVDSTHDIAAALTRLSQERGGAAILPEKVRPLVSLGAATLVAQALGPVAGDPQEDLAAFRMLLADSPSDPAILYPGVREMLAILLAQQWRLAIVTNKPEALTMALLRTHRLDRCFMTVVGGDTAAHPKPDPAPLRHALTALHASPDQALFVGDSDVDAMAAATLNIPLLFYTGGYGPDSIARKQALGSFAAFSGLPALVAACR